MKVTLSYPQLCVKRWILKQVIFSKPWLGVIAKGLITCGYLVIICLIFIEFRFWFYRNHQVQLDTEGDQVFTVQGVDEYGYLEIKSKDGGKTISVQPDGNSYDMMRNLIHMKTHWWSAPVVDLPGYLCSKSSPRYTCVPVYWTG